MSLISTPFVGTGADIGLHAVATIVLVGSIVAAVVAFWKLHELPIHKAQQSGHRQLGLVTILTWIGFIWHWVWVIAIIVAFADIESSIVRLRDLWRYGETSVEEESC